MSSLPNFHSAVEAVNAIAPNHDRSAVNPEEARRTGYASCMGRVILFAEQVVADGLFDIQEFDELGFTVAVSSRHCEEFKAGRFWYGHAQLISPDSRWVLDSYKQLYFRTAEGLTFNDDTLTDPEHIEETRSFRTFKKLDSAVNAYLEHPDL